MSIVLEAFPTHLPSAFVNIYLDLALSPQFLSLSLHSNARGPAGLSKCSHGDNTVNKGSSRRLNLLSAWVEDGKSIPLPRSSARSLAPAGKQ